MWKLLLDRLVPGDGGAGACLRVQAPLGGLQGGGGLVGESESHLRHVQVSDDRVRASHHPVRPGALQVKNSENKSFNFTQWKDGSRGKLKNGFVGICKIDQNQSCGRVHLLGPLE